MTSVAPPAPPSFAQLYTPKLVTVLREGYGAAALRRDALAGLTVAIVALPLSMAIAIASGVGPERGLYAAIIGGFLVSALGGSRFQIGGPAGAFIVLVAACVQREGVDGLILATLMSGAMLAALGFARIGAFIKFIPYPVVVGFTSGIAAIIFVSQIAPALGLSLTGPEPGPFLEKAPALWAMRATLNPWALALALLAMGVIVGLKKLRPRWPGMLIAVALTAGLTALFDLPVETVGTRFGGLPHGLPAPGLPEISAAKAWAVLPDALAFTLLGAIESLLSAVVADAMTGRRHRSNCELVGQGAANIGAALFGGFCVTGTIARTATNVRAGAHGPVAGMIHAVTLLAFLITAAPLADSIPLAALAGVLIVVAWNMAEFPAFGALLRGERGDAVVLLATFALTVLRDLSEAIVVGFAIGAALFIHRMSRLTALETGAPFAPPDEADDAAAGRDAPPEADPDMVVLRVRGALFFGAAAIIDGALERIGDRHRAVALDLSEASVIDSSGARSVAAMAEHARKRGVHLFVCGAAPRNRRALLAQDVRQPLVLYAGSVAEAQARWRAKRDG